MSGKQIGIFVILLIVFFPAAFIYLAVVNSKRKAPASTSTEPVKRGSYEWTVLVNKGSKVYHCDQICANNISAEEMPENKAIKLGLHRCKKCFGSYISGKK